MFAEDSIRQSLIQLIVKTLSNEDTFQYFKEYLQTEKCSLDLGLNELLESADDWQRLKKQLCFQVYSLIRRLQMVFMLFNIVKDSSNDTAEEQSNRYFKEILMTDCQRVNKYEFVFNYLFNSFKHTFQGLRVMLEKLHENDDYMILQALAQLLNELQKDQRKSSFEKQIENLIQNILDLDN